MELSRRDLMLAGLALLPAGASARIASAQAPPLAFDVEVPVDHDRPALGRFALPCEWGAPRQAGRPTVVAIADAQQYYVRPGGAARLQRELFGDGLNVLTIVGRSRAPGLAPRIAPGGTPDWDSAVRLLNWRQWARDVEAVIRRLALRPGELCLYGRSGGAHLIHQLLTLRPDLNARAYVQAAVNHELDMRWGVSPDPFWAEFSAAEPAAARALAAFAASHAERRRDLVLVLQRQHFFVPLDELPAARLAAARAFLDGDEARIGELRSRYQVDLLERNRDSAEGVGSAVRVHEFAAPHADPRRRSDRLDPDVEALFHYSRPLSDAAAPPHPSVPTADWSRLREQRSEVLQVAGRHDQTCDYRTQIGLSGLTRNSRLLLLDDDHVFKRWTESGSQPALLQAFFRHGGDSPQFRRALAAMAALRWREA